MPALLPAMPDDTPASGSAHPDTVAVDAPAISLLGLIRALDGRIPQQRKLSRQVGPDRRDIGKASPGLTRRNPNWQYSKLPPRVSRPTSGAGALGPLRLHAPSATLPAGEAGPEAPHQIGFRIRRTRARLRIIFALSYLCLSSLPRHRTSTRRWPGAGNDTYLGCPQRLNKERSRDAGQGRCLRRSRPAVGRNR